MLNKTKISVTTLAALFFFTTANAQIYGVWKGAKKAIAWEYNLKGTKAKFSTAVSTQASISNKEREGYLTGPSGGTVRLSLANSGQGDFEVEDGKLKITSSSGNFPVKFSAYNIPDASAVASLFFDISFNANTAANGLVILGFGTSSTPVYNNYFQLTGAEQPGLFGAVTLTLGENYASPRYRYPNANTNMYGYSALSPANLLKKEGTHKVELYCNNSADEQEYKRGEETVKLPSRNYHLYINGVTLKTAGSMNLPATQENKVGDKIDAFIINGSNNSLPSENTNNYTISNIKVGFGK
jgi:hypothetical protein